MRFENIEYTEENQIPHGGIIWKDGKAMIKVGHDANLIGLMISTLYEDNWTTK